MIEESGRVVAVENGRVWVEAVRKAGCGRCDEPGGCGNGALTRHARDRLGRVLALNTQSLALDVGDPVLVGVPANAVLRGALLIYALPLLALLAGAASGDRLIGGDVGAVAGVAVGLLLSFVLVRLLARRAARNPEVQPIILRRLSALAEAPCTLR